MTVPKLIRSSIVYGSRENFRIVIVGPRSESGGMIAFTRLPSGRRASTIGDDSSIRRPTWDTILSMILSRWALSAKVVALRSSLPSRSMKIRSKLLTMTSVTVSSRSSGSNGP